MSPEKTILFYFAAAAAKLCEAFQRQMRCSAYPGGGVRLSHKVRSAAGCVSGKFKQIVEIRQKSLYFSLLACYYGRAIKITREEQTMKKIVCFALAALMLLSLCACGNKKSDEKVFTMGIDAEYPPFSYMDDEGNYTGFDVEVCKAVCDKLGWKQEIFSVNWDNKLIQLDAKECDCVWSGMTIMDSMREAGYVLSAPYYDSTQVLVVKADSGFASSADLAGKVVTVQLGTSGEKLLAEGGDMADMAATFAKVVTCDSFLKCFTELDGGAADAVFVDKPVAEDYIKDHDGFAIIDENLGVEQYGIAFRKDDQDLCKQVEDALAELVADGTYAKIAEKYPDIVKKLLFLN